MTELEKMKADATKRAEVEHAKRAEVQRAMRAGQEGLGFAQSRVARARAELAADLGVSPSMLRMTMNTRVAPLDPVHVPIWGPLFVLTEESRDPQDIDMSAVRESRHVLAAIKMLPPVRTTSDGFGIDGIERARHSSLHVSNADILGWFGTLCSVANLSADLTFDVQPFQLARQVEAEEIESLRRASRSGFDSFRATQLVQQKHDDILKTAREAKNRQNIELRERVIHALDRDLKTRELGAAWWWLRELLRVAVVARFRTEGRGDQIFGALGALGVDLPKIFEGVIA